MTSVFYNRIALTSWAAVAVCLAAACSSAQGDEGGEGGEGDGTPVTVAEARAESIAVTERSVARSEAFSSPLVAAEVTGRVEEIRHDVGDEVENGAVLARVDAQDYQIALSAAEADAEALRVRIEHARRELSRLEELGQQRHVSESEVDAADAELRTAEEELKSAETRRDEAQRALQKTAIRAPMAGRIDERTISEGDYVQSGSGAFRLVPDASARVALPYPERVGDRLEIGQPARVRRLGQDDEWYDAELTRLRPAVDEAGMGVVAIIEFEPPETWRSGALLEGEVVVEERKDAVVVPSESLQARPERDVVYVAPGDEATVEVEEREVELGHREAEETELLRGADAGERVVVDGAAYLTSGTRVRIRTDD